MSEKMRRIEIICLLLGFAFSALSSRKLELEANVIQQILPLQMDQGFLLVRENGPTITPEKNIL